MPYPGRALPHGLYGLTNPRVLTLWDHSDMLPWWLADYSARRDASRRLRAEARRTGIYPRAGTARTRLAAGALLLGGIAYLIVQAVYQYGRHSAKGYVLGSVLVLAAAPISIVMVADLCFRLYLVRVRRRNRRSGVTRTDGRPVARPKRS